MSFQLICAIVLGLVIGALALVAGYRLFLVLLPIWGFFAGFAVGAHATALLFGDGFLATVTGWIIGFVSGIIFAVLSYLIYIVGVALLSAAFGYFLAAGIMLLFIDPGFIVTLVGLAGAVVMAFVVLRFNIQKPAVELITAFGGATAVLTGVLLILGTITLESLGANPVRQVLDAGVIWLIAWLILGFVGFGIQINSNRTYVIEPPENKI